MADETGACILPAPLGASFIAKKPSDCAKFESLQDLFATATLLVLPVVFSCIHICRFIRLKPGEPNEKKKMIN